MELAKKTRVPANFDIFGPQNGWFFAPFRDARVGQKPGIFAPSGRAEIPKMLKADVQKHQNSTGFIRFSDMAECHVVHNEKPNVF